MSDLWSYMPEKCDGDFCPMNCDRCTKNDVEDDEIENEHYNQK